MIMTTFKIFFCIYTRIGAKIRGPHTYPPIGQTLLFYRATPTLIDGIIVSLVRVGVAL